MVQEIRNIAHTFHAMNTSSDKLIKDHWQIPVLGKWGAEHNSKAIYCATVPQCHNKTGQGNWVKHKSLEWDQPHGGMHSCVYTEQRHTQRLGKR